MESSLLVDIEPFLNMLRSIDVQRSTATNPDDRKDIIDVIRKTSGFSKLNTIAINCMVNWLIGYMNVLASSSLGPENFEIRTKRLQIVAKMLTFSEKYDDARTIYKNCLIEAQRLLGKYNVFSCEAALELLRFNLELDVDSSEAVNQLHDMLVKLPRDAPTILSTRIRHFLGVAYLKINLAGEAVQCLEQALSAYESLRDSTVDSIWVMCDLADALQRAYPDDPNVVNRIKLLYEQAVENFTQKHQYTRSIKSISIKTVYGEPSPVACLEFNEAHGFVKWDSISITTVSTIPEYVKEAVIGDFKVASLVRNTVTNETDLTSTTITICRNMEDEHAIVLDQNIIDACNAKSFRLQVTKVGKVHPLTLRAKWRQAICNGFVSYDEAHDLWMGLKTQLGNRHTWTLDALELLADSCVDSSYLQSVKYFSILSKKLHSKGELNDIKLRRVTLKLSQFSEWVSVAWWLILIWYGFAALSVYLFSRVAYWEYDDSDRDLLVFSLIIFSSFTATLQWAITHKFEFKRGTSNNFYFGRMLNRYNERMICPVLVLLGIVANIISFARSWDDLSTQEKVLSIGSVIFIPVGVPVLAYFLSNQYFFKKINEKYVKPSREKRLAELRTLEVLSNSGQDSTRKFVPQSENIQTKTSPPKRHPASTAAASSSIKSPLIQQFQVQIPADVHSGQPFLCLVNGRQIQITCPNNVRPGDKILVAID